MLIDAHQHCLRYTPDEHGWIDDSMSCLRREFLPEHLKATSSEQDLMDRSWFRLVERQESRTWWLE
jgi:hypothetical protein